LLLKSAEHFKDRFDEERERRIEAEKQLAIAEPKAAFYDQVADS
jgi:phage antirepressor YoqD-like protein